MTFSPGTRLGAHEIVASIGAGGMGEVYRARDTKLGRDVAIKSLPEDVSQDPERLARFEREARAAAALNHPGIVTIDAVEQSERTRFLAMELIEGESLGRKRRRTSRTPCERPRRCPSVSSGPRSAVGTRGCCSIAAAREIARRPARC